MMHDFIKPPKDMKGDELVEFYQSERARLEKALRFNLKKDQNKYTWIDFDGRRVLIQNDRESLKTARKAIFQFLDEQEKASNFKYDLTEPISKLAAKDAIPNNLSFRLLDDMSERQRYLNKGAARAGLNRVLGIDERLEGRIIHDITRGKKSTWGKLDPHEQDTYNDLVTEIKREAIYGSGGGWDYPEFNIGKWNNLWRKKATGVTGKLRLNYLAPVNRVMNKLNRTPLKTHDKVHRPLALARDEYKKALHYEAQKMEAFLKTHKKDTRAESGEIISEMLEGSLVNGKATLQDGTQFIPNNAERDIADWLRRQYDESNLVPQDIKIANYNPRISKHFDNELIDIAEVEQTSKKSVKFFAEFQRDADKVGQIRDALELYRMYMGKGLRKKYFDETIKNINEHLQVVKKKYKQVGDTYEELIRHDVNRFLGIPSAMDYRAAETVGNFFRRFGIDWDNDQIMDFGRKTLDIVYMNGLSNPKLAVRNLFQTMLTTADMGSIDTLAGIKRMMLGGKGYYGMLENRQVFSNLKAEWLTDYRKLTGRSGSTFLNNAWDTSKNVSMAMFDFSDKMNRMIAYGAGENKMSRYIKKYGVRSKQVQKIIRRLDPAYRREIEIALNDGLVDEAIHRYAKRISDRTQYMYSSEGSPLLTSGIAGKFTGQFLTWTGNYAGLVTEWSKNNPIALIRHAAYSMGMMYMLGAVDIDTSVVPFLSPFQRVADQGIGAFQSPAVSTLMDGISTVVNAPEAIYGDPRKFNRSISKLVKYDIPMFIPFSFTAKAIGNILDAENLRDLLIKPSKKKKTKTTTTRRRGRTLRGRSR
jgi:hypothetical protein